MLFCYPVKIRIIFLTSVSAVVENEPIVQQCLE